MNSSRPSPSVLPPFDHWYAPASSGDGYALQDPLHGGRLDPNKVPDYITNEPDLKTGIDFLAMRRSEVEVTVGYGTHDQAEDLGNPAQGWFEGQVKQADYYGYEGIGTTQHISTKAALKASEILIASLAFGNDLTAYINTARQLGIEKSIPDFQLRRWRAMAISATPSFNYDVALDGTDTERRLYELYYASLRLPTADESAVGYLALVNAREWMMVAKAGLALHRAELGKAERPLEVFLTMGVNHRDVTRKYQLLGTTVLPKLIRISQQYNEATDFPHMLSTGIILEEDLPMVRLMHHLISRS